MEMTTTLLNYWLTVKNLELMSTYTVFIEHHNTKAYPQSLLEEYALYSSTKRSMGHRGLIKIVRQKDTMTARYQLEYKWINFPIGTASQYVSKGMDKVRWF